MSRKSYTVILALFLVISCSKTTSNIVELSKTSTSWDGELISYPKTDEEITTIHITLPPQEKLPFHCHPVPTLAYVISGKVEVEKLNGKKKLFNTGEEIIEVVNSWHRGYNPSLTHTTKIIVFYVGKKKLNNTILYSDKTQHKCR